MTDELEKKVRQAVSLIQKAVGDKVVEVAYSGGKDSDVILEDYFDVDLGWVDARLDMEKKQFLKQNKKMSNYCKRCRLRDGCLRKCKEAEVYEQGYNDAYDEIGKALRMCKQIKKQKNGR